MRQGMKRFKIEDLRYIPIVIVRSIGEGQKVRKR